MQLTLLLTLPTILTAVIAQPLTPKAKRDGSTKLAENNANGQDNTNLAPSNLALAGGGGLIGWLGYEALEKSFKGMKSKGSRESSTSPKGAKEVNMRALEEKLSGVTFSRDDENMINLCKDMVITYYTRRQHPVNEQAIELQCKILVYEDAIRDEMGRSPEELLAAVRSSRGQKTTEENQAAESRNGDGPMNFHSVVSQLQGNLQRIGAALPKEAATSSSPSSFVGLPVRANTPTLPKMNMVP